MRWTYLSGECAVQYPDERIFLLQPANEHFRFRFSIRIEGILCPPHTSSPEGSFGFFLLQPTTLHFDDLFATIGLDSPKWVVVIRCFCPEATRNAEPEW